MQAYLSFLFPCFNCGLADGLRCLLLFVNFKFTQAALFLIVVCGVLTSRGAY